MHLFISLFVFAAHLILEALHVSLHIKDCSLNLGKPKHKFTAAVIEEGVYLKKIKRVPYAFAD